MTSARNILVLASLVLSVLIGLVIARGKPGEGGAGVSSGVGNSSGGTSSGAGGKIVIGLSLDTLKEARWQVDSNYFVEAAKKLGAEVLVQSANSDDSQQLMQISSMLTSGVKALVIVPHDAVAMAKAVELAHQAGVPVIGYDRIISNCDLDLYLSFDNVRVGELQAKYLVDHLPTPGKGKIVRIYGAPTDNNAKLFKQGQDQVLAPYLQRGDIVVVHEDWAEDWKPENAKKIVNAAIVSGDKFDGILASNDGTAGGAIQALVETGGLAGKIVVTGQDAELPACQRIVAGTQASTIYKPIRNLANAGALAAVNLARGKPIIARQSVNNGKIDVPSILCDVVVVTKENMTSSVIKDGYQPYDDVYRGVPDAQRPPKP